MMQIQNNNAWDTVFKLAAVQQEIANRNQARSIWLADIARETDNPELFEAATGWKVPRALNPFYNSEVANMQEREMQQANPLAAISALGEKSADVYLPTSMRERPEYVNNVIDYAGGAEKAGVRKGPSIGVQKLGEQVQPGNVDTLQKIAELTGLKPGDQGWDEAVSLAANKQMYAQNVKQAVEANKAETEKANIDIAKENENIRGAKKIMGGKYLSDKDGGSAGWGADAKQIIENFNYAVKNFAKTDQDVLRYYNLATSGLKDAGVTWKRNENPLGPLTGYLPGRPSGTGGGGGSPYSALMDGKPFPFTSIYNESDKRFREDMDKAGKNIFGDQYKPKKVTQVKKGVGDIDITGGYKIDRDTQERADRLVAEYNKKDFLGRSAVDPGRKKAIISQLRDMGITGVEDENGNLSATTSSGRRFD